MLRQVIVPVDDVSAAVSSYGETLGLELRFQDGERWAAFDAGGLTFALAGPGEQPAGGGIAVGVKVADLEAAIAQIEADGGELVDAPTKGEHERRATCRDSHGTTIALYEPLA